MFKGLFFRRRKEIVLTLFLFVLALGIRVLYQKESIVDNPVRADAARYLTAAYNLYNYGVYSLEKPTMYSNPPESRTNLSPGYPLFLTLFMQERTIVDIVMQKGKIVDDVVRVQAVMGALTTVCTFLLARLALSMPWAFLAGILTALSPHLISMDNYLLTESLFTFIMVLGTLLFAVSWEKQQYLMTLFAAILLSFSAYVRTINLLFLFFLAPIFLLHPCGGSFMPRRKWVKPIAAILAGFTIVAGAYYGFLSLAVKSVEVTESEKIDPLGLEEYNTTTAFMKDILSPPQFYVDGKSHIAIQHSDRRGYKKPAEGGFWEHPLSYIKWNLFGKLLMLWNWDDSYNGDVYIYPMLISGFEVNMFLKAIHGFMYFVHWPLFMLSLMGFVLIVMRRENLNYRMLLPPALGFAYFIIVLSLLNAWLPRYTIPVRPFSYILASVSLSWFFSRINPHRREDNA